MTNYQEHPNDDEELDILEEHYTKKKLDTDSAPKRTKSKKTLKDIPANQNQELDDRESQNKDLAKDLTKEKGDEPIIKEDTSVDKTDVSDKVLVKKDMAGSKETKEICQESTEVVSVLKEIPDTLTCGKVKPKDKALNAMLDKVRDYLSTRSHLDDLTDETTMGEVKTLLNSMAKDDRLRILNVYTDIRYGDMDEVGNTKRVLDAMQEHPKVVMIIGGFILLAIFVTLDGITGKGNDTVFSSILKILGDLTGIGGGGNEDLKI